MYPSPLANSDPRRARSHQSKRGSMPCLIRRALTAAAVFASVATPLTLWTTQAGAQAVKGAEALNSTLYLIGVPPDNPGAGNPFAIGGGPETAGGVVLAKGTAAITASLPGDPAGSSRAINAFPNGTFTGLGTGGGFTFASLNQSTCRFIGNLSDEHLTIVSGTGEFAAATGTFTISETWTGYLPHAAGGGCNLNGAAVFAVVQAHAVGSMNLHTP